MFDKQVYKIRRQRLAQFVQQQGGGVVVLSTAPEVMRNRDSDYPYRWDSYFYYLTGFIEPQATLVMLVQPDGVLQDFLFCRDKNAEREIWDGFRFGPTAAQNVFLFDGAYAENELASRLPNFLMNVRQVFYPMAQSETVNNLMRQAIGDVRSKARSGINTPIVAFDLTHWLDEMRLYKDTFELTTMGRAAAISADAHVQAMRVAQPGVFEYAVEAELLYHFRKGGAQSPAYGSIVAGGANACVLHYRANDQILRDGELLLIDAGCELDGYASDITRTFPVNGRFTQAQRDCYEIVLAAQAAAIEKICPDCHFNEAHDAAVCVLAQGMLDLKLLTGTLDSVLESGAYKRFYMHRTGHWLGMDVHDCGAYRQVQDVVGDANSPWRILQSGMVLTVEPGLYIRAADDIPQHFWNIGIRIEDDAVITPQGCEILTQGVPKTVVGIEDLMRQLREAKA